MSATKKIKLVAGSAVITALLILGLARLPVAYPLQATLDVMAQRWAGNSFEAQLAGEMDRLLYQRHRPMMYHLVMLQVAEQARLHRLERLQSISRADRQYWWILQPGSQWHSPGYLDGGQSTRMASGNDTYVSVQPVSRPETRRDLVIALVCFSFVIAWVLVRRP